MTGQSLSAIKYSDACSVRSLCDSYARAYVKLSRRFSLTSSWPCLDRKERERKTFFISCGGQRKSIDYGIVSCDSQLIASARQKRKLIIFSWRELSLCSRSVSPIQLPQPWTSNCNSCTFKKAHKIPASSEHLWEMVPHKSGAKANINSPRFCFSLLNDLFDRCQIVARTFPRIFRLRETSCFPPLPPLVESPLPKRLWVRRYVCQMSGNLCGNFADATAVCGTLSPVDSSESDLCFF